MTLYRVVMFAARSVEFPECSRKHGYDFVVPLDAEGRLDPDAWKNHKQDCTVHRFWENEADQRGILRHTGKGWVFDYDQSSTDDNEPFFKLDRHVIQVGEYLSVTEQDGETRTFLIHSVEPLVAK